MNLESIIRLSLATLCISRVEALQIRGVGGSTINIEKRSNDIKGITLSKNQILSKDRLNRLIVGVSLHSESLGSGITVSLNRTNCVDHYIYPVIGGYITIGNYWWKAMNTNLAFQSGINIAVLKSNNKIFDLSGRCELIKRYNQEMTDEMIVLLKSLLDTEAYTKCGAELAVAAFDAVADFLGTTSKKVFSRTAYTIAVVGHKVGSTLKDWRNIDKNFLLAAESVYQTFNSLAWLKGLIQSLSSNSIRNRENSRIFLLGPFISLQTEYNSVMFYIRGETEFYIRSECFDKDAEKSSRIPVFWSLKQIHIGFSYNLDGLFLN